MVGKKSGHFSEGKHGKLFDGCCIVNERETGDFHIKIILNV